MNTTALRTLIIYAVILPLAVFVGWMISGGMTRTSFATIAAIVFVLLLPALLKWHYEVLFLSWNTAITVFFLPGQPTLWMLVAGITFGIAVLNRIIQKQPAFLPAPSITFSLLALLAVVMITAKFKGGLGFQAFGSATYGGKRYIFIIAAIIAYFALASRPIPTQRAKLYVTMMFLPAVVFCAGSNLIYFAGPSFYFLYLVFPVGFAGVQASSDMEGGIVRVAGFWVAASLVTSYLFAAYGIRGIIQKWWRVGLLLAMLALGSLGGFRSFLLQFGLIFIFLFFMEGLLRSPIFPALVLIGVLGFAAVIPFATKLPLSVQRTLSILPIKVDPLVRRDAEGSVDWRVQMWQLVIPDLPQYIWMGKGYTMNPTDMYLTEQAMLRHRAPGYESALLVGDYHNGPLSVYVPFGSFGALAFLMFLVVSIRALYLNYRYGLSELRTINRFLFAFFCAKTVFFFVAFGSLHSDLYQFTGIIGVSIAMNKGICRKPVLAPRPVLFHGRLRVPAAQTGGA